MFRPELDLAAIRRDLTSHDQETRGRAMQDLSMAARRDVSLTNAALPLFADAITSPTDAWTASSAARGIEAVAGREAGQRAWRTLLASPREDIAERAALSMTSAEYFDDLVGALSARAETRVCCAAIRTLGRMQHASGFEVIAPFLDRVDTRADAIQAMGELGDERAIRLLEQHLDDRTELWREDNHGPMLRVCDLALDTIGILRNRRMQ